MAELDDEPWVKPRPRRCHAVSRHDTQCRLDYGHFVGRTTNQDNHTHIDIHDYIWASITPEGPQYLPRRAAPVEPRPAVKKRWWRR